MNTYRLLAAAALLLSLLTGACAARQVNSPFSERAVRTTPIADLPINLAFQTQLPTPIPEAIVEAADAEHLLLTNLYERLVVSVVNVDVTVSTPHPGIGDQSTGSGVVYDREGHIITNAHVVNGAIEVYVTFHDGYVAPAEVVGLDYYSDIAVLRVQVDPARLFPVEFGDSDALRVGQRAIAIGNPFGLSSSMTVGIVSGLGRQLPSAELINNTIGGFQNPSIIQVDAEINPGNSGGPLLNSWGELVGINTAIRTESGVFQGVGFAVPSRTVARVVPELIEHGTVNYAWIGISSLPADGGFSLAGLAEALNLPVTRGVLIDRVTPGSPADDAGLRGGNREVIVRGRPVCVGGDIIVAVNGTYIDTMDELVAYLVVNTRPGTTVDLLVVRGDETFEVPVTLRERPNIEAALSARPCGSP